MISPMSDTYGGINSLFLSLYTFLILRDSNPKKLYIFQAWWITFNCQKNDFWLESYVNKFNQTLFFP